MEKLKKVYLVEKLNDDACVYYVIACFDTEEKAKKYVDKMKNTEIYEGIMLYNITEMEVQ